MASDLPSPVSAPLAIECLGVSKHFRQSTARPRSVRGFLLDRVGFARRSRDFWALRDVTFRLQRGRSLGVVGTNGSGKTTLLRVVSGLIRPTAGSARVTGRLGAMLELGAGFHPEFTGRENVMAAAVIAGLTRAEVRQRLEAIVEFAELADFIDQPVRTYSSGMQARLAFATAIHTDPEILIIDEVLAVGDQRFQSRCVERIEELRGHGCTIMLVSHDLNLTRRLCDETLWLKKGRVVTQGPTEEVLSAYLDDLADPSRAEPGAPTLVRDVNRWGSGELEISQVRILNANDEPVTSVAPGESITFELRLLAHRPIRDPLFGIIVDRSDGVRCFHCDTESSGLVLGEVHGQGSLRLHVDRLDLAPGEYFIDVIAYGPGWVPQYDHHWRAYCSTVADVGPRTGILRPPYRWSAGLVAEASVPVTNGDAAAVVAPR